MKATIIIGTPYKGCTHAMQELFKEQLSVLHSQITFDEYVLPNAAPHFCIGCKNCFEIGEEACPHYDSVAPIWASLLESDILIFIFPMYVMRVPGQLKALLDHFGYRWASHRPEPRMSEKRAIIITQGIGAPTKHALKDVETSLRWWGVSDIRLLGIKLLEGVIWDKLSLKRRAEIEQKLNRLALSTKKPLRRNHLETWIFFKMCQALQRKLVKKGAPFSIDTQYWIDNDLL